MTLQNEPAAIQAWDSCLYTAEEERDFLKRNLSPALRRSGLEDIQLVPWLWGGLQEEEDRTEEAYLREQEADLAQGIRLDCIPEADAERYRTLFRRTAGARRQGSAAVLQGIDVYLVCGRKPV